MLTRAARWLLMTLLILNGLLFVSNIYVLGDAPAAIAMHDDLSPSATAFIANLKVLVCFDTGLLYLAAAVGVLRQSRPLVACGMWALLIFDGTYLYELAAWGLSHPRVWLDFTVFGGLSLLFGCFAWREWRRLGIARTA
jgi:hypothetical protein